MAPKQAKTSKPDNDRTTSSPISGITDLRPKRPPIDWEEVVRLHRDERLNFREIARKIGYSAHYLRERVAEMGSRDDGAEWDAAAITLFPAWSRIREQRKGKATREPAGTGSWPDFRSFREWSLANGYVTGFTLVRIDPAKGYSPANCRFVSKSEAAEILKRNAKPRRPVTAFGETKGIMAWALDARCQVSDDMLRQRLDAGVDPETAISTSRDRQLGARRTVVSQKRATIDWSVVRDLYELDGRTPTQIAREFGTWKSTISSGLRKLGIAPRMRPGITKTPDGRRLHKVWSSMRARCEQPEDRSYSRVGAKGIVVCEEWSRFDAFMAWAHAAGWNRNLRIARVDPLGPFSPGNCRFVSHSEVVRDRPTTSHLNDPKVLGTAFGETKGMKEWSRDSRCVVSFPGLLHRIQGGMRLEEAITKLPMNPGGGTGQESFFIEAFGQTKCLADWLRDPRCRVTANALRYRLRRGMKPETAISMPRFQRTLRAADGKRDEPHE